MNKQAERYAAFAFGVAFVVVLLLLAVRYPNPTPFQYTVFRIVLALAAGGVAAMIPGFLTLAVSNRIRASGALAVFVVVYFYSPAELTGVKVKTEQEIEIEKPVIKGGPIPSSSRVSLSAIFSLKTASAESATTLPSLVVSTSDALAKSNALGQRYQRLRVDGVRATMPPRSTIVANEIEGLNGGAIVGSEFSVVARRLANLTVDASGNQIGAAPGTIRLYVKIIENARVFATGAQGAPGQSGAIGLNGKDGANGRDGSCAGFGGYRGATPGGSGGDAGNGSDGQPGRDGQAGGFISITTIVNPVSSVVDVSGGPGGAGGAGGLAGTPGRGGTGGRGCTGLGGSQPNEADGKTGRPAQPGKAGQQGRPGATGEYQLLIVKSFDPILQKLSAHSNEQLHAALLSR